MLKLYIKCYMFLSEKISSMPSYINGQRRFKLQRLCVKESMESQTQSI
jgi:hypothetical protein